MSRSKSSDEETDTGMGSVVDEECDVEAESVKGSSEKNHATAKKLAVKAVDVSCDAKLGDAKETITTTKKECSSNDATVEKVVDDTNEKVESTPNKTTSFECSTVLFSSSTVRSTGGMSDSFTQTLNESSSEVLLQSSKGRKKKSGVKVSSKKDA